MENKNQKDQAEELSPDPSTRESKPVTSTNQDVELNSKKDLKTPDSPSQPKEEIKKSPKGIKSKLKSKPVVISLIVVLAVVGVLFLLLIISGGGDSGSEEIIDVEEIEEILTPEPFVTASPELIPETEDLDDSDFRTFKSDKLLGLQFPGFSITYPKDWSIQNQRFDDKPSSKVTLKTNGHVLVIEQDGSDNLICLFVDQTNLQEGEFLDLRNSIYKEIDASFGIIRRTEEKIANSKVYTYCEDLTTYETRFNKNNYKIPTSIGKIIIQGPSTPDLNTINEMEEIIKTLEEI